MAALPEPSHHPQRHTLGQHVELGPTRRVRGDKARELTFLAFDVDAVEGARVQMHVEIQARAEALHEELAPDGDLLAPAPQPREVDEQIVRLCRASGLKPS
jgi:hypothetical protein